jgi:phospholipase/lecithinase/hemolysin
MSLRHWLASAGQLACAFAAPAVRALPFKGVLAFGDSLTDTGNLFATTGDTFPASPPYFNGHFSDGPVWVERLAANLGLPAPIPSLLGGTNNAWGGAETDTGGVSIRNTPNLGTQVATYLSAHPAIDPRQLVVVWGGANDYLHFPMLPLPDPAASVANVSAAVTALAQHGAHTFLVPNLPALGLTPYVSHQLAPSFPGIAATINGLAAQYDELLAAAQAGLESSLGIDIIPFDAAAVFDAVLADPTAYGFTNLTDQAKNGGNGVPGTVAPNPGQYLFWDEVHPSAAMHRLLGDEATAVVLAALVPERRSLWPMGSGLALLMAVRRRVA